jgi:hypothetical protein
MIHPTINKENKTPEEIAQEEVDLYFIRMCYSCDFEHIKYLLTSPELQRHANVHAQNDKGFANILDDLLEARIQNCSDRTTEIMQYLIFDFNIEKTKDIEKILISRGELGVKYLKMFEQRELNNILKSELIENNDNPKKTKI